MKAKLVCNLCGQNNWIPLYKGLIRCRYCGLIRSGDNFFKLNPKNLYDESYYNGKDYLNYEAEEEALNKNFKDRIGRIKIYKKRGRILDVGCAYGFFLKVARDSGYKPYGLELNKEIAITASEISKCKVYSGDLKKLAKKIGKFDIITMFDVIEHLKNPDEYIKICRGLLRRNGLLVIETGNIESWLSKVQKPKWRLIVPNIHLFYFSKTTLKKSLEKNTFRVISLQTVGFYRTLGQTVFRLTKKFPAFLSPLFNINYNLNTHDLIFVIAKK